MNKIVGILAVLGLAGLLTIGGTAPALADASVRNATVADLYVRDADPSLDAIAGQFAALWNPNLPIGPKEEVSYHGSTVGPALQGILSQGGVYDFLSIQLRATSKHITGDRMTAEMSGVMAGFPASNGTYTYVREDGLWKVDWKATCDSLGGCTGNPDFGY
ncbi:hypothetical protein NONO_c42590 [Nocardia nova SH22a]|uniref:Low molecular weight antigen MTB12-like C-terminal domain-containing protein n=1 Tax=Nocardia nova SH22a TaxID=1415166 RepID=W5TJ99_9NOCA|nr:hypothetical protein [Nocardia nova]AHH19043.1 hypothetical protein NONO_c42590 [Nocardia nova SH22a]